MSTTTLVSFEEYLGTSYRPDCDYVDGAVIERTVGQKDHSKLLGALLGWFRDRHPLIAFPSQRLQVSPTRCRVPDICVVHLPEPEEQVFTQPPCICIEILSPEDRFPKLQDRLDDYLAMGVPNLWVIDPASRRGWRITTEGHFEALDHCLRTPDGQVSLPISDLFALPD